MITKTSLGKIDLTKPELSLKYALILVGVVILGMAAYAIGKVLAGKVQETGGQLSETAMGAFF